jgi:hypothetical protein
LAKIEVANRQKPDGERVECADYVGKPKFSNEKNNKNVEIIGIV